MPFTLITLRSKNKTIPSSSSTPITYLRGKSEEGEKKGVKAAGDLHNAFTDKKYRTQIKHKQIIRANMIRHSRRSITGTKTRFSGPILFEITDRVECHGMDVYWTVLAWTQDLCSSAGRWFTVLARQSLLVWDTVWKTSMYILHIFIYWVV